MSKRVTRNKVMRTSREIFRDNSVTQLPYLRKPPPSPRALCYYEMPTQIDYEIGVRDKLLHLGYIVFRVGIIFDVLPPHLPLVRIFLNISFVRIRKQTTSG